MKVNHISRGVGFICIAILISPGCSTTSFNTDTHEAFYQSKGIVWSVYDNEKEHHFLRGDTFRIYEEKGDIFFVPGRQMTDPFRSFYQKEGPIRLKRFTDDKGQYLCASGVNLSTMPGVDNTDPEQGPLHEHQSHILAFRLLLNQTVMSIIYEHSEDSDCKRFHYHGGRAHAEN